MSCCSCWRHLSQLFWSDWSAKLIVSKVARLDVVNDPRSEKLAHLFGRNPGNIYSQWSLTLPQYPTQAETCYDLMPKCKMSKTETKPSSLTQKRGMSRIWGERSLSVLSLFCECALSLRLGLLWVLPFAALLGGLLGQGGQGGVEVSCTALSSKSLECQSVK